MSYEKAIVSFRSQTNVLAELCSSFVLEEDQLPIDESLSDLVVNVLQNPMQGVEYVASNVQPGKSRVCLLSDYHIDRTMLSKRQNCVRLCERQLPVGIKGRIVLLEGVEAKEDASKTDSAQQFIGGHVSHKFEAQVVGCDSADYLQQSHELLCKIASMRKQIQGLQARLTFVQTLELEEIDLDDEAELRDAITAKEKAAVACWNGIKYLASERSKIMAQTVEFYLKQNPDAFIYLVAGKAHIEDLVNESYGLSAKKLPFSAVVFEVDEGYHNVGWKDVEGYYNLQT